MFKNYIDKNNKREKDLELFVILYEMNRKDLNSYLFYFYKSFHLQEFYLQQRRFFFNCFY